ncbi:MAG TPA: hypothetical protein VK777_10365 [Reyranella sp.]|nr:hypothetical protein [Reyranella sp.]
MALPNPLDFIGKTVILAGYSLVAPTLFLASDTARWINGHTLNVDPGFNVT